ncbi:MAG: hypothetical protein AAFS07_18595 [Pseudomonadota bacterium]
MTPATFAEKKVLNELQTGLFIEFGEGLFKDQLPPDEAGSDRQIRASFVRWLAIGGDGAPTLHAKGLRIAGALITNDGPARAETAGLDLQGAVLKHDLALVACRFQAPILLRDARLQSLVLNHAHIPGSAPRKPAANRAIGADRLETRGSVFLRGARCEGAVRLLGARIGGGLDCDGATLTNPKGNTLHADGLEMRGDLFLSGARCEGAVRLLGARIGGDLDCSQGTLLNAGGAALHAGRARVDGVFFLRQVKGLEGVVDLTGARLGSINDEPAKLPSSCTLILERCVYDAFTGQGVSAVARLPWLARQRPQNYDADFWPQPWEQCAKVFREGGHREDARLILIDKERRLRADQRASLDARLAGARHRLLLEQAHPEARVETFEAAFADLRARGEVNQRHAQVCMERTMVARYLRNAQRRDAAEENKNPLELQQPSVERRVIISAREEIARLWWLLLFRRVWDGVLASVVGYGHLPQRAFLWALGVWLLGAGLFAAMDGRDAMMPNNPFILRSAEWVRCSTDLGQEINLASTTQKGASIETEGLREPGERTVDCFERQPEAAAFPTVDALAYSADTLLPIVSLHLEQHWTPNPDKSWGWWGRIYLWVHIILGWALSLLAVAGFSGLVKSD